MSSIQSDVLSPASTAAGEHPPVGGHLIHLLSEGPGSGQHSEQIHPLSAADHRYMGGQCSEVPEGTRRPQHLCDMSRVNLMFHHMDEVKLIRFVMSGTEFSDPQCYKSKRSKIRLPFHHLIRYSQPHCLCTFGCLMFSAKGSVNIVFS